MTPPRIRLSGTHGEIDYCSGRYLKELTRDHKPPVLCATCHAPSAGGLCPMCARTPPHVASGVDVMPTRCGCSPGVTQAECPEHGGAL